MLLVALLSGCIENGLSAPKSKPDSPAPDDTHSPGRDSGADSGESGLDSVPDEPCALQAVPAGPASAAATCSALPEVSWELALELDFPNVDDSGAGTYIGSPVVAPMEAGGPPAVFFQTVLASSGGSVLGVDGSGNQVLRLDDVGYDLDHLAVIRDAMVTGSGIARFGVPTVTSGVVCATADGLVTGHSAFVMSAPGFLDVDHDGVPELVEDHLVLDSECRVVYEAPAWLWNATTVLADITGQFDFALVSGSGVGDLATGGTTAWDVEEEFAYYSVFNMAILSDEGEIRILAVNKFWVLLAREDGSILWMRPVFPSPNGVSINAPGVGDLDGDGRPEVVIREGSDTISVGVYDLEGNRRWRQASGPNGGLSLADLNADGVYEVVDWSDTGLRIFAGATGELLSERADVFTLAGWSDPVIADVDSDGSAEIIVGGDWVSEYASEGETIQDHLFVFGAATGRFARTRPVWNQTSYDITTIRDDGSVVRFPRTSWQTYNAFRAQPSHDGDRPDLSVTFADVCADLCGPGGMVQVGVQVDNLGSVEAPVGATIRLYTWTASGGVQEVASSTLSTAIPAMWSAEGVVFTVPWEDWGDGQYVQVDGAHSDECDLVNDRIDILDDPCE